MDLRTLDAKAIAAIRPGWVALGNQVDLFGEAST